MLDLDHFKKVNDTHGHLAGDAVLANLASVLLKAVRNEDVVARFGGEEFAIILRAIALDAASQHRRAAAQASRGDSRSRPTTATRSTATVSIGVAGFPEAIVATPSSS